MAIRRSTKPQRVKRAARPKRNLQRDPTLWRDLAEIGRSIPRESLAKLPRDLGRNADHYLDGSPKQN
jgi:hypothetical protein